MTNEQLLQQAKDQVAEAIRMAWLHRPNEGNGYVFSDEDAVENVMDVFKLAIQSAREEAAKEAVKTLQSIQSDSSVVSIYIKASEAIKKLTAPGR